ncbi:MAG: SurA N-terminal domain-containing protein [Myxococcota bacterium]|nr:SurA N-terminal domain-containing protein [Myxococcota bacterium]
MGARALRTFVQPFFFAVAVLVGGASDANATIVERVVAVVGERAVLWTDVLRRAGPTRVQIRAQTHDANVVSVQEQEMYRELLERMIDDRVEEQQADKAHITISAEEIDRGIANIATQAQQQQGRTVTEQEVLAEVRRRGLTEQDFRDEIRRQIIEGKLIELRVRPRVRVTDQDARAAYQHWVRETKEQEPLDVRILALRVGPQATRQQVDARMALAQELAAKVRAGSDFCQLVTEYTEDIGTRESCGSRGPQPFASLLPPIQEAVRGTKPGDVSDPVVVHIGAEDAIVILMPLGQPRVPEFEAVKNEMTQRALLDALERARKQWLQELRRNVYIDVRL